MLGKNSTGWAKFDAIVGRQTMVKASPKKFAVEVSNGSVSCESGSGKLVTLDKLEGMDEYERVTVVVKVVQVDDAVEVAGGRRKQDVIVGDSMKSGRVTV